MIAARGGPQAVPHGRPWSAVAAVPSHCSLAFPAPAIGDASVTHIMAYVVPVTKKPNGTNGMD